LEQVRIKINNQLINNPKHETLRSELEKQIEETKQEIEKKNRNTRRSKAVRKLLTFFTLICSLGMTSVAGAEENGMGNHPVQNPQEVFGEYNDRYFNSDHSLFGWLFRKAGGSVASHVETYTRDDSIIWKFNDFFKNSLLHTDNFFDSGAIEGLFKIVFMISMSFLGLVIGKKGYDMITAKVLGSNSMGTGQLIIRILGSIVMSFLSLKVVQIGIDMSNSVIQLFFKLVESQKINFDMLISYADGVGALGGIGHIFWIVGYVIMFGVILVRFWLRQMELVVLGVLSPVATFSWIVDGGAMLGNMIKETIVNLTTPIVHSAILIIGTVILYEVTEQENIWAQIGLPLATMVMMIFTPEFLRKFIHGDANPVKSLAKTALQVKAMPLKVMKLFK
jgi:hypothetical protein